jgi:hypothetical protein
MTDVVVHPCGVEGLRFFAARDFVAGERIRDINVVREVTPASALRPEFGERSDQYDYPDGRVVLTGLPDRHVNYSCDPNGCMSNVASAAWSLARRAISSGTEITLDHNLNISRGVAWPWRCRASRCICIRTVSTAAVIEAMTKSAHPEVRAVAESVNIGADETRACTWRLRKTRLLFSAVRSCRTRCARRASISTTSRAVRRCRSRWCCRRTCSKVAASSCGVPQCFGLFNALAAADVASLTGVGTTTAVMDVNDDEKILQLRADQAVIARLPNYRLDQPFTGHFDRNPFYDPDHDIMRKAPKRLRLYDRRTSAPPPTQIAKGEAKNEPDKLLEKLLEGWKTKPGSGGK